MKVELPSAVPKIPVSDIDAALEYHMPLGFNIDWGDQGEGGIAGISNGNCRMFLTDAAFRKHYGNTGPVLIWLNLDSKENVDALYQLWRGHQAKDPFRSRVQALGPARVHRRRS